MAHPKRSAPQTTVISPSSSRGSVFAGLVGLCLALALWKFGNAVILNNKITAPANLLELIYQSWPTHWGYGLIALVTLTGLMIGKLEFRREKIFLFAFFMPLLWLGWQFVSAIHTVDATLTSFTLQHFVACMVCFYLGWFCLGEVENHRPLILGVSIGLAVVLIVGWQQHFGGLEQSRQYFLVYVLPTLAEPPPKEYLAKLESTRIFSTLFYPNTLAAALLLLVPFVITGVLSLTQLFAPSARRFLAITFGVGALGCLVWSGSKSGWLIALFIIFISVLHLSFSQKAKVALMLSLLLVGFGGFFWKYASFFERGATSVVARFDYWRAAVEISQQNPVFGTGPGTFLIPYEKIKDPESEIARLTHNDYLEQASDSGLIGCLAFTLFILGSLVMCRPKTGWNQPLAFSIWLGVLAVCLHSLVEFNLYIPAIAWPLFLFLGWLWSRHFKETNRQQPVPSVDSARQ